jgi:hypothetical protein
VEPTPPSRLGWPGASRASTHRLRGERGARRRRRPPAPQVTTAIPSASRRLDPPSPPPLAPASVAATCAGSREWETAGKGGSQRAWEAQVPH